MYITLMFVIYNVINTYDLNVYNINDYDLYVIYAYNINVCDL